MTVFVQVPGVMGQMSEATAKALGYNYTVVAPVPAAAPPPPPTVLDPYEAAMAAALGQPGGQMGTAQIQATPISSPSPVAAASVTQVAAPEVQVIEPINWAAEDLAVLKAAKGEEEEEAAGKVVKVVAGVEPLLAPLPGASLPSIGSNPLTDLKNTPIGQLSAVSSLDPYEAAMNEALGKPGGQIGTAQIQPEPVPLPAFDIKKYEEAIMAADFSQIKMPGPTVVALAAALPGPPPGVSDESVGKVLAALKTGVEADKIKSGGSFSPEAVAYAVKLLESSYGNYDLALSKVGSGPYTPVVSTPGLGDTTLSPLPAGVVLSQKEYPEGYKSFILPEVYEKESFQEGLASMPISPEKSGSSLPVFKTINLFMEEGALSYKPWLSLGEDVALIAGGSILGAAGKVLPKVVSPITEVVTPFITKVAPKVVDIISPVTKVVAPVVSKVSAPVTKLVTTEAGEVTLSSLVSGVPKVIKPVVSTVGKTGAALVVGSGTLATVVGATQEAPPIDTIPYEVPAVKAAQIADKWKDVVVTDKGVEVNPQGAKAYQSDLASAQALESSVRDKWKGYEFLAADGTIKLDVDDAKYGEYQKDLKDIKDAYFKAQMTYEKYERDSEKLFGQYQADIDSLTWDIKPYVDAEGNIDRAQMVKELGEAKALAALAATGNKPTIAGEVYDKLSQEAQALYTRGRVSPEYEGGIFGAWGKGVKTLYEPVTEFFEDKGIAGSLAGGMFSYLIPQQFAYETYMQKGPVGFTTLIPHFGTTIVPPALSPKETSTMGWIAGAGFAAMPWLIGPVGSGVGMVVKPIAKVITKIPVVGPISKVAGAVVLAPVKALGAVSEYAGLTQYGPWRLAQEMSGVAGKVTGLAKQTSGLGSLGTKWGWWNQQYKPVGLVEDVGRVSDVVTGKTPIVLGRIELHSGMGPIIPEAGVYHPSFWGTKGTYIAEPGTVTTFPKLVKSILSKPVKAVAQQVGDVIKEAQQFKSGWKEASARLEAIEAVKKSIAAKDIAYVESKYQSGEWTRPTSQQKATVDKAVKAVIKEQEGTSIIGSVRDFPAATVRSISEFKLPTVSKFTGSIKEAVVTAPRIAQAAVGGAVKVAPKVAFASSVVGLTSLSGMVGAVHMPVQQVVLAQQMDTQQLMARVDTLQGQVSGLDRQLSSGQITAAQYNQGIVGINQQLDSISQKIQGVQTGPTQMGSVGIIGGQVLPQASGFEVVPPIQQLGQVGVVQSPTQQGVVSDIQVGQQGEVFTPTTQETSAFEQQQIQQDIQQLQDQLQELQQQQDWLQETQADFVQDQAVQDQLQQVQDQMQIIQEQINIEQVKMDEYNTKEKGGLVVPPILPPWLGGLAGVGGWGTGGLSGLLKGDLGIWETKGYSMAGVNPLTGKVTKYKALKKTIRYGDIRRRPRSGGSSYKAVKV